MLDLPMNKNNPNSGLSVHYYVKWRSYERPLHQRSSLLRLYKNYSHIWFYPFNLYFCGEDAVSNTRSV